MMKHTREGTLFTFCVFEGYEKLDTPQNGEVSERRTTARDQKRNFSVRNERESDVNLTRAKVHTSFQISLGFDLYQFRLETSRISCCK